MLQITSAADSSGRTHHTHLNTTKPRSSHLPWEAGREQTSTVSRRRLLTVTALYHNHQRKYIGTELTITTHDCGISSPALSFSQAVHQKTVILRKSYLTAYLNNHSPILEETP